jgi:GntR family transcriptional regulator
LTVKLNFQLDFRSDVPIYEQIAEVLRKKIAEGQLSPGDQLPTVRQLALDLRVNFNTVSRAYRVLDEARLISTQRGRGTYIWEEPTEETMRLIKKKSLEELARTFLKEAARLGFSVESTLEELKHISSEGAGSEGETRSPQYKEL